MLNKFRFAYQEFMGSEQCPDFFWGILAGQELKCEKKKVIAAQMLLIPEQNQHISGLDSNLEVASHLSLAPLPCPHPLLASQHEVWCDWGGSGGGCVKVYEIAHPPYEMGEEDGGMG